MAYIAPMSTEDVDVFVIFNSVDSHSLAPLRAIYADLISRGAKVDGPYLVIGGWPVQFLASDEPLYADAISHARTVPVGSQAMRVIGPEHLAVIALRTGRSKDHLRLLEFLNTGILDEAYFKELVERFGFVREWKEFRTRFPA